MTSATAKIAVIGLGYVGLPLAMEFAKRRNVIGFDLDERRIRELSEGFDQTCEVPPEDLLGVTKIRFTTDVTELERANFYIVTVPTPIDICKKPDLKSLVSACKNLGRIIKKGNIVVFESTVYPGVTEEICVPILEKFSGLSLNKDFYCGYSPERINPGDKEHRISEVVKVVSGSTEAACDAIESIYSEIIKAGVYRAPSIKVAEAAKVIENTQRDVNIALINELALIFDKLQIDTEEVLKAASTKWNFLPFSPGLVGGHCIGVDPYYLTHKAIEVGYQPEIILAGRRLNDAMGGHVVDRVVRLMNTKGINVANSNVLILGFTFKENCPDFRNTRVIDLVRGFENHNCNVSIFDPWVSAGDVTSVYDISMISEPKKSFYDAIVIAVSHSEFISMTIENIHSFGRESHVVFDVKHVFKNSEVDGRL
ncbi:nucleotide sugar dehydrogenase [Alphaproteobacteria bacterium]|nr:nucleotide sugar dehydrogenase [Alphaproteobacteria bacterium]